jgi:hypothetical protein
MPYSITTVEMFRLLLEAKEQGEPHGAIVYKIYTNALIDGMVMITYGLDDKFIGKAKLFCIPRQWGELPIKDFYERLNQELVASVRDAEPKDHVYVKFFMHLGNKFPCFNSR